MSDELVRRLRREAATQQDPEIKRRLVRELFRLGSPPFPRQILDGEWERAFNAPGRVFHERCGHPIQQGGTHSCKHDGTGPGLLEVGLRLISREVVASVGWTSRVETSQSVLTTGHPPEVAPLAGIELGGGFGLRHGCSLVARASFIDAAPGEPMQIMTVEWQHYPCPIESLVRERMTTYAAALSLYGRRGTEIAVRGRPIEIRGLEAGWPTEWPGSGPLPYMTSSLDGVLTRNPDALCCCGHSRQAHLEGGCEGLVRECPCPHFRDATQICACGHPRSIHDEGEGPCGGVCSCAEFRAVLEGPIAVPTFDVLSQTGRTSSRPPFPRELADMPAPCAGCGHSWANHGPPEALGTSPCVDDCPCPGYEGLVDTAGALRSLNAQVVIRAGTCTCGHGLDVHVEAGCMGAGMVGNDDRLGGPLRPACDCRGYEIEEGPPEQPFVVRSFQRGGSAVDEAGVPLSGLGAGPAVRWTGPCPGCFQTMGLEGDLAEHARLGHVPLCPSCQGLTPSQS